MRFYTDGSRVGKLNDGPGFVIGWAGVCDTGVIAAGSRVGGSNINAEIFAIRDTLRNLLAYRRKMLENAKKEEDNKIEIVTDSKTSIQIITGMTNAPNEYNLDESENYKTADEIIKLIIKLKDLGFDVSFEHIRGHRDNIGNVFADYVATTESNKLLEKEIAVKKDSHLLAGF